MDQIQNCQSSSKFPNISVSWKFFDRRKEWISIFFFVSLMAKPPPREILVIECYYLLCNYIVVITITVLVIEAKVLNYHSHSLIKEAARRNSSTFIYYHNSQFLVRMNLEKRKAEAEKNRSSISCRFSFPVHIYKEKKSKS